MPRVINGSTVSSIIAFFQVVTMYMDIPPFESPVDRGVLLWRYMQTCKLRHLLETRTLFFPRADQFQDLHEGLLPVATARQWPSLDQWIRDARRQTFVSCWCQHDGELDLMWRAYLHGEPGVVVFCFNGNGTKLGLS